MKQPQSKSCQDFPGRRYSGSGSTHQCGLRERHTNQMYRAVLSTLGEHCVLEEEFVSRRNKGSNSADVGKDRHEHWHCSSLSARTNSTATLSFSLSLFLSLGCLPFTLLLSDRSLLPPLLPSSIAKAGASSKPATSYTYISAQLQHALHCCLSYSLPIKPTRRSPSTILIASPTPSTFGYIRTTTHTRLRLTVQLRGFKNAHKIFN